MAFLTRVNNDTGLIEQSLVWFEETGSPPTVVPPVVSGSPPEVIWLPDSPPVITKYQSVIRTEPVPPEATEIEYVVSDLPLEQAKAVCKAEVDVLKFQKIQVPVVYNGNNYDSDPTSLSNLTATVAIINAGSTLPPGFTWRDADNNDVSLDAAGVIALADVMFNRVNDCYNASWTHKNAINALTTTADVAAYDMSSGWPV